MELSIKPLRCFVAVADLRSFTRAADRMCMTQPSLSIQITQLEKNLGFRLFDRSTRQVVLTPQGEAFLDSAERLIEHSDQAVNAALAIRGELANKLRLGAALYTYEFPERIPLVEDFISQYPQIEMTIDSREQRVLMARIMAHNLDLALVIGIGLDDESYEASDKAELIFPLSLRRAVLRRERVGLLVPESSDLARYDVIPRAALHNARIVMPTIEHGQAFINPIQQLLHDVNAQAIYPPDTTGTGVERYGRKFGLPAITFGWFPQRDDGCQKTVRRNIEGFDLTTEYALVGRQSDMSDAVAKFIAFTEKRALREAAAA